jgi:hypothetical protein
MLQGRRVIRAHISELIAINSCGYRTFAFFDKSFPVGGI